MGTPAWWCPELPELVQRREPMPGIEKWQTTYVRYKCQPEAQAAPTGWELPVSQRYFEQYMLAEQSPFHVRDSPLHSGLAPVSVNMRIVESPAEYAVPVKQDRRLTPDFKIRVEVRYKNRVSFPLTLKAYVITQQEKDSLPEWLPDDLWEPESPKRKQITELKGTTCITHHFEANVHGNTLVTGGHGVGRGGGSFHGGYGGYAMRSNSGSGGAYVLDVGGESIRNIGRDALLQDYNGNFYTASNNNGNHGVVLDGMNYGNEGPIPGSPAPLTPSYTGWESDYDSQFLQQLLASPSLNPGLDPFQRGSSLTQRGGSLTGMSAALQRGSSMTQRGSSLTGMKAEPGVLFPGSGNGSFIAVGSGSQTGGNSEGTLVQDFEFANVEFVKPTRMNKVYMVFACSVFDQDIMFVIYNIPTVGICRAEQRAKACQKLGISYGDVGHLEHMYMVPSMPGNMPVCTPSPSQGNGTGRESSTSANTTAQGLQHQGSVDISAVSQLRKRMAQQHMHQDSLDEDELVDPLTVRRTFDKLDSFLSSTPMKTEETSSSTLPRSRSALRDWIQEEYSTTALLRNLTRLDVQALESQAGFPTEVMVPDNQINISVQQWEEFQAQFRAVLQLLKRIATVWNMEDPCIISGFDMDRNGTVQALAREPSGTFICRFSMSQAGCLVLTCKVGMGHPSADQDGLLHAIIKIDDLNERRVDTWIRDFAGATHVLDVYKNKRVDKRKLFPSNYYRLRALDIMDSFDGY